MLRKKYFITLLVMISLTFAISNVNATATIVSNSPADGATSVNINPRLTAYVNSTNASTIYFMYNDSGTWSELYNTTGVNWSNQKITYTTNWATYEKSYTYTVNVSDVNNTEWKNSSAITFTLLSPTEHTPVIVYAILPVVFAFAFINLMLNILGKFKI